MTLEIRKLGSSQDLAQAMDLQAQVWGLSPREVMSPITLCALAQDFPRTGWLWGGFLGPDLAGLAVLLATDQPGQAYLHMLGVRPALQGQGLGWRLLNGVIERLQGQGLNRACWTFEPLDARNAHLYLNKLGGLALAYHCEHFHLEGGPASSLPLDRFVYVLDLARRRQGAPALGPLAEALAALPLATAQAIPAAPALLLEIPPDLPALLKSDPTAALAWRGRTRPVLEECLNQRGMVADGLYRGLVEGQARAFYRLRRA